MIRYRFSALILFLLFAASLPAIAQEATTLESANELFGQGNWIDAARAYQSIVDTEPQNGAAWFGLGHSLYNSRQVDPSLAAYLKALELGFEPPTTMLQLARCHAVKGEDETAVDWIEKAVQTGAAPLRALTATEEFKRLEANTRYATIMEGLRPCNTPAHHLLDFWLGSWRVVVGEEQQQVGKNSINSILNGCAIIENWTNIGGSEGKSLFYYHDVEKLWKQVWVTDNQGLKEKHLIGVADDGAVRFQGEIRQENGALILDRTTLFPLEEGRVRQLIEQSVDGGETWQKIFDALYLQ